MKGYLLLQVLEAESSNVKALYRRAQGHLAQQDFVEAELDIKAALLVRILIFAAIAPITHHKPHLPVILS